MKNIVRIQNACILALFVLVSPMPGFGASPDSLSIEEAIRIVVANHPSIAQAAAMADASGARVQESRSAYYPTVEAEASYLYLQPIVDLAFPGLGDFMLFPANNYDAHVGVRQLVYDFGKTSTSVEVGEARERSARRGVDELKTGLAYQTVQSFYSILLLQRSIAVENHELVTLNQHLVVNQKRLDAGTGTDFEILTTQVRIAAAETRKIDLQNSLDKQQIALRRLLGISPSTPLAIHGDFGMRREQLEFDKLVNQALSQRAEYRRAREEETAASLQQHLAGIADLPTVNLSASYGLKNGYLPNLDALRGNWTAGVQVQVPIYAGGRTGHKEEEEAATVRAAQARLTDLERQIQSEVRDAVADVQAASQKVKASELQVRQAEDALSIARKRYDAGTVSNLDVLDAETSLAQTNLLQLRAEYAYVISRYALDRAIGTQTWR